MSAESVEIKVARMDERLKSVERIVNDVKQISQNIEQSTTAFHEKANKEYVTKMELHELEVSTKSLIDEVKKNILRNLIGTNLLTAAASAVFMYLLQYYLTHK